MAQNTGLYSYLCRWIIELTANVTDCALHNARNAATLQDDACVDVDFASSGPSVGGGAGGGAPI